jgi:hypothetical protein
MLPQPAAAGDREVPAAAPAPAGDVRKDSPAVDAHAPLFDTVTVCFEDGVKVPFVTNNKFPVEELFKQEKRLELPGMPILLHEMQCVAIMKTPTDSLSKHHQDKIRQDSATSICYLFTFTPGMLKKKDQILATIIEFTPDNKFVLFFCYPTTLSDLCAKAAVLLKKKRLFVILDLDKTLLVADYACPKNYKGDCLPPFASDIEIEGRMVVTDDTFSNKIMLRAGAHRFLDELQKMGAELIVLTAGDKRYGDAAVKAANEREWATGSPDESLPPTGPLPQVRIPLDRVFSVRNHPRTAIDKDLHQVIPISLAPKEPFLAIPVDDNRGAWGRAHRHLVEHIVPFKPTDNSPDYLLNILENIKRKVSDYFDPPPTMCMECGKWVGEVVRDLCDICNARKAPVAVAHQPKCSECGVSVPAGHLCHECAEVWLRPLGLLPPRPAAADPGK